MSLVGYRVKNHPQQVGRRGARPEVDDRKTPPEVWEPLNRRFAFTLDVAASSANALLPRYFTKETNALRQSWSTERVWCNPPHSNIEAWVEKAWDEWHRPPLLHPPFAPQLIVMLLPANRTEQGWWQRLVEPYREDVLRVEFLPGRIRFIAHDRDRVLPNERPPYGCCLLIWEMAS